MACRQPRQGRKKSGVAHTLTLLLAHIVFSTKERRAFLNAAIRPALFAYLGGIARELDATAIIVNGVEDHVHLLVAYPAAVALADLVRVLKTNSSLWLRQQHRATHSSFAWQSGYGAFSVSHSARAAVVEYIAGQEEGHQRISFEHELRTLLGRHEITHDERFLLG